MAKNSASLCLCGSTLVSFHPHTRTDGITVAEDVVHAGDVRPEFVFQQALGRERGGLAAVRTIPRVAGDLVGGVRGVLEEIVLRVG